MSIGILGITILTVGCGGESGETKAAGIDENSSQAPEEEVLAPLVETDFCDCISGQDPQACVTDFITSGYSEEEMINSSCYRDQVLQPWADDLCECLNNVQQVSLECDELQREMDEKLSSIEQASLNEVFGQLDCLPE